jgi:hypothetical protein
LVDIRIIKTGINVSKIKAQLEQYADDWGNQKELDSAQQLDQRYLHHQSWSITIDSWCYFKTW